MKKNKVRDRRDFISDFIIGELKKKGTSVKALARETKRPYPTFMSCVRGFTAPPEIKNCIITALDGVDPWEIFPPIEYVPPKNETAIQA